MNALPQQSHVLQRTVPEMQKVSENLPVLPSAHQEVVYVGAKLRLLEHRQQRISEVRAKYQCLKKELEQTKQHLMLEPHKWTGECELASSGDGKERCSQGATCGGSLKVP